jgi:hypothetical protein
VCARGSGFIVLKLAINPDDSNYEGRRKNQGDGEVDKKAARFEEFMLGVPSPLLVDHDAGAGKVQAMLVTRYLPVQC